MIRNYMTIEDKVLANGDNEIMIFTNTAKNEEKIEAINKLKVASALYDEDIDTLFELQEDRKNAISYIKKQIPILTGASVAASYFMAHLSLVPYDGDVNKLLTSWAIHAGVITTAMIGSVAFDSLRGKSEKDIDALKRTVDEEETFIMNEECVIDDIELEEATVKSNGLDEAVNIAIDAEPAKKHVEDSFELMYLYNRYPDKVKKAYLKGKLDKYLHKLGLDLTGDLYEQFVRRIEKDLYDSNRREVIHSNTMKLVK